MRFTILVTFLFLTFGFANAASISKFTQSMEHRKGFFDIYYDSSKANVFLKTRRFDKPFLLMTSLPYGLGSNDIGLDRGLQGGAKLVELRKVGQRVFLIEKNTNYVAVTDNDAERRSVEEAFAESIIAGFDIVASDKKSVLIDVTPFLLSDRMGVAERIESTQQGNFSLQKNLSSVDPEVIKSFPKNTELQSILTFSGSKAGNYLREVSPNNNYFTLRQRLSFIELPESDFESREFHPFSGFWTMGHRNYAAGLLEPMDVRFIPRHKLKKKNPELAVSEPVEPIVYYVDSGAPEKIRNALIEGALWWNQAFEAAGYKNAFQVKVMPKNMDPMDVRYNVILWVHRATRGWSYGASITDPRTGEIIKGHVTLGSLRVRQDLLIAKGLTSPFESEPDLERQQAMALNRIKQLSAHEVGHTLGIAHNFAASVHNRASVMDYPHPLVQLNDGKLVLNDAYDLGIGEWDKQVIKYGYSEFSSKNHSNELDKIIRESKAMGLEFVGDSDARPVGGIHPAGHLWDNGKDPVDELYRLIEVRKFALDNFDKQVIADGVPYSEIEEALVPIFNLHRYQVEAAAKLIAGRHYSYSVKGEDDVEYKLVPKKEQREALNLLLKTMSPEFLTVSQRVLDLIPPKAYGYSKTRESFKGSTGLVLDPIAMAEAAANHSLNYLLNLERMARLSQQSIHNNLTLEEVLLELSEQTIKSEHENQYEKKINMRVSSAYLSRLLNIMEQGSTPMEVLADVVGEVERLRSWLNRKVEHTRASDSDYGYYHALLKIIEARHKRFEREFSPTELPPGSPIGA
ncbi:zinc-dependent metalloprotease [Pleionea sediminis]|uniref:zinc-dependent metalloprotease n=1 Tax=Pleionea sediminis TaxID=2569479 RepID=UPI001185EDF5|nr:zinc-dependent metalloprotease [Pleionea sediminis]